MARTLFNLAEDVGSWPNWASGAILLGNNTSQPSALAPGASGNAVVSNGSVWQSVALGRQQIPETVTLSSATSLTLTTAASTYVFTGSVATTWTLPAVSGNTGRRLYLENRGTAQITAIPAGADFIWFLTNITSTVIATGGSMILVNDGTYWNILSNDVAHNAVGILPVANGGTGTNNLTLNAPIIKGYTETVSAMGTVGATATVPALTNGTLVTATLTASTATTFTMPTAAAGAEFWMVLKQPAATGNGSATFTGVKWPGGTAPVISTAVNAIDILSFVSDGTNWYGAFTQAYA